jgi:ComF family protein
MRSSFILPSLRDLWGGVLHLLYPDLCVACQKDLPLQHSCFCLSCRLKCQPFGLDNLHENEIHFRLWGRLPIQWAAAGYHFTRKSPIQKALHQLKYHNKPDLGLVLGRELGKKILASSGFRPVDAIVPVPLHPKKERIRGYNQSAMFALGLSEVLQVPVFSRALVRKSFSGSQTTRKRMERFENTGSVFSVAQAQRLSGKHILLVDDVLTTGATIEMCGLEVLSLPGTELSLAVIAAADI